MPIETMTRRRRDPARDPARADKRELAGLIAVAAGAMAGAAILFLFTTRTGREARARLQDGDVLRRWHDTWQDTMEELQRLAQHGAAYVERKAGELRQAIGEEADMLDARYSKGR